MIIIIIINQFMDKYNIIILSFLLKRICNKIKKIKIFECIDD